MGRTRLVIHSKNPDYVISDETLRTLLKLHEEIPIETRLGLNGAEEETKVNSTFIFEAFDGFEVRCPNCQVETDESWAELMGEFYDRGYTDPEPVYTCQQCRTGTRLTHLTYEFGCFTRFSIVVTEAWRKVHHPDIGPYYSYEPDTSLPFWTELQKLLGTELKLTWCHH